MTPQRYDQMAMKFGTVFYENVSLFGSLLVPSGSCTVVIDCDGKSAVRLYCL